MKEWFVRNLAVKVICFFLALILWFYVKGEQTTEIVFSKVPLNLSEIPSRLVPAEDTLRTVSVTLCGQRKVIAGLNLQQIGAELSLKEGRKGNNTYYLTPERIFIPTREVKVVSVKPAKVMIKLEKLITKWVIVRPKLTGELPKGYKTKIKVHPEAIKIEGPQSSVEKIKEIKIIPLNIEGITENFTKKVSLESLGKYIKSLRVTTVNLTVEFINLGNSPR